MKAWGGGKVYRARRPRETPLWRCMHDHFDRFIQDYTERHQPKLGFLRPVIPEVVEKFLDCGNMEQGFARVRCPDDGVGVTSQHATIWTCGCWVSVSECGHGKAYATNGG
jgi:hypothetical protein